MCLHITFAYYASYSYFFKLGRSFYFLPEKEQTIYLKEKNLRQKPFFDCKAHTRTFLMPLGLLGVLLFSVWFMQVQIGLFVLYNVSVRESDAVRGYGHVRHGLLALRLDPGPLQPVGTEP